MTHLERVLKFNDLPQAFYRWESRLKEFQRGRPAELDDNVKAYAMKHMMPKEILDAVGLQPQYRTFSRNSKLHVAAGTPASCCFRGRRVPSNSENWHSHATYEHKHEQPYHHKWVSQMRTSRKLKRWNRRATRISTSKIRSAMETNCLQSRARAKVALKEHVSSAE